MIRADDEDPRAGIEIRGVIASANASVVVVRIRVDGGYWFDVPRTEPFVMTSAGDHLFEVQIGYVLSGNRRSIPYTPMDTASAKVSCVAGFVTQYELTHELAEIGRRPLVPADAARARDNHVIDPDHPFDPALAAPPDPGRAVLGKPRIPDADPAAGWFPDPSDRHELRYHDGTRWTLFVDDHGVTDADTL